MGFCVLFAAPTAGAEADCRTGSASRVPAAVRRLIAWGKDVVDVITVVQLFTLSVQSTKAVLDVDLLCLFERIVYASVLNNPTCD